MKRLYLRSNKIVFFFFLGIFLWPPLFFGLLLVALWHWGYALGCRGPEKGVGDLPVWATGCMGVGNMECRVDGVSRGNQSRISACPKTWQSKLRSKAPARQSNKSKVQSFREVAGFPGQNASVPKVKMERRLGLSKMPM